VVTRRRKKRKRQRRRPDQQGQTEGGQQRPGRPRQRLRSRPAQENLEPRRPQRRPRRRDWRRGPSRGRDKGKKRTIWMTATNSVRLRTANKFLHCLLFLCLFYVVLDINYAFSLPLSDDGPAFASRKHLLEMRASRANCAGRSRRSDCTSHVAMRFLLSLDIFYLRVGTHIYGSGHAMVLQLYPSSTGHLCV